MNLDGKAEGAACSAFFIRRGERDVNQSENGIIDVERAEPYPYPTPSDRMG